MGLSEGVRPPGPMADELRRDRSKPKLAQAIALYHLVIEASLAQPGQHLIEESLKRRDLLPGFREGIGNVSRDEQRHIAFGVKMIADLIREDAECLPAIEELLREVFPYTAAVLVPPGWDERYVTAFGFTLEEIYTYGADALDARLRAAGIDPTDAAGRAAVRRAARGARPPRPRAAAGGVPGGTERSRQAEPGGDRAPVRRPAPSVRRRRRRGGRRSSGISATPSRGGCACARRRGRGRPGRGRSTPT